MAFLKTVMDFVIHIDKYLGLIIEKFGAGVYLLLFLVVFAETGLVIMPFLPGDSLLFAAGTFAGAGELNVTVLFLVLAAAAILGDTLNYWIGNFFGANVFAKSRLFKKEYYEKTKSFYEKHGGKTIILARFVPFMRTFAPFVAGVGNMRYLRFFSFNVLGGIAWVSIFVFGGYFFGGLPFVKENLTLVLVAIIITSLIPPLIGVMKEWKNKKKEDRPAN